MSASLMYHLWKISGYDYVHTRYEGGSAIFRIEQKPFTLRCPCCGCRNVTKRGVKERLFRAVPVGTHPVFVELPVQRAECDKCKTVRQVKVPLARERRTYFKSFERYALELSRHMTIQDAAVHLKIGRDTVKDIQKHYLHKRFEKPKLRKLKRIAIDGIYLGKTGGYLTIVMDLTSGAAVHVGEGKSGDALKDFWKRLRSSKARIEAAATDMGTAYIKAVRENLPDAVSVCDHFHVVKLYNEKLSNLRRSLFNEAQGLQKEVLKGSRRLLLKTPVNLDVSKNEHIRLQEAQRLNQPLATAYYMKDELRQVWKQEDKENAAFVLDDWIKKAAGSGIRMLQQFAKRLAAYRSAILAYYDFDGLSTGPLEGVKNKIKTLQKTAYGFRDKVFLKLKIKALHETKYALVG